MVSVVKTLRVGTPNKLLTPISVYGSVTVSRFHIFCEGSCRLPKSSCSKKKKTTTLTILCEEKLASVADCALVCGVWASRLNVTNSPVADKKAARCSAPARPAAGPPSGYVSCAALEARTCVSFVQRFPIMVGWGVNWRANTSALE